MLTIIIPYRNREDHLKKLILFFKEFKIDFHVVVVEQCDSKPFNRGKLINCAFIEFNPTYFIAHDVDMFGELDAYNIRSLINVGQLCRSNIQTSDYLGGATMYHSSLFVRAEGYHNDYFHRAEDNEMMFNLRRKRINVTNWNFEFEYLPHERTGPEFIPELWKKAQQPRTKNMLKTCEYELISKEVKEGYTHLKVLL